jgi:predicted RNase H-like nuclease (RuvC/YqgF family)
MGSPLSKIQKYSAFLLSFDGNKTFGKLTLRELLKTINDTEPDIVASDNVFELASDPKGIIYLIRRFPTSTKLVQVTGSPADGMEPLAAIATKYGLTTSSKLSPIEAAEVCARLAAKGVGYIVSAFENETKIIVSRGRTLGPGGSSSERFRRRLHTFVLQITQKIKNNLDDAKIDYDLYIKESEHGLKQAKFLVYADRAKLEGLVKPIRSRDVQVKFEPVLLDKLEWIPLIPKVSAPVSKKGLILGIDPGMTCGLAVLDLNANLLSLRSEKELTRKDIIRETSNYGVPVYVCSDVYPPPEFVKKLCKSVNAKLFSPFHTMSVAEKREITRKFLEGKNLKVKDSHQRDALASAIKAYQALKNKFEQVEAHVKEMNVEVPLDQVKASVARGVSISEAITSFLEDEDNETEETTIMAENPEEVADKLKKKLEQYRLKLRRQRETIQRLEEQITQSQVTIQTLKEEVNSLNSKLETLRSENLAEIQLDRMHTRYQEENARLKSELAKLKNELSSTRLQLSGLRRMKLMESRGIIYPLKTVKSFTQEEIRKADEFLGIKAGDIIFLQDATGGGRQAAEFLVQKGVSAVICGSGMSHIAQERFFEADIPVIPCGDVNIKQVDEFTVIDKEELERVLAKYRKATLEQKKVQAEQLLDTVVKQYREERQRELLEDH